MHPPHLTLTFLQHALSLALGLVVCMTTIGCEPQETQDRPPNVIIIFTDDQGYEDVGVYGAQGYTTPNLDRMAAEGMRFTQFYVAASGCSPSRAALLTGSYPMRVGIPDVLFPRDMIGLHPDELTIADLLKEQGYATKAVGKWHLGNHPYLLPTNNGFDSYLGFPYSNDMSPDPANNPRANARRYPPLPLIRDTTIIAREPNQANLTRRYTEEALSFINEHQDQPFFLYLAHAMPHAPLWTSADYTGLSEQGMYGDVIQEIDGSTGQILDTLDALNLTENTLVVFTSDNGPWLIFGDHSGSAGPLREGKGTSFEGGHRVPGIVRWPSRIPAGIVSDEMVTTMDLLPTIAHLTGASLPADRVIDGYNIWPILSGDEQAQSPYEKFFYYRAGHLQAVRSGQWKLHVRHTYRTPIGGEIANGGAVGRYNYVEIEQSLFDLENDIGETTDVADQNPDVVERLLAFIDEARTEIGDKQTETVGTKAREPGRIATLWEPAHIRLEANQTDLYENTDRPYRVFLLAGQSNMVGSGDLTLLSPTERQLPENVRFFADHQAWDLRRSYGRFGPEITLAHQLAEAFPQDTLVFIKTAVGGSSLLDWAPEWNEADATITGNAHFGPLYEKMQASLAEHLDSKNVQVEALLWMQGERDARIPEAGEHYYRNFETLITRLRADLGEALPVLFGHVNPPVDRYPAIATVNQAQEQIAQDLPKLYLVDTDGLSKLDDQVHYDTEGQRMLGQRFADMYLNLQN